MEMEAIHVSDNNTVIDPNRYLTYGEMYMMEQFQRHLIELATWSRVLVMALKFNLPNTEDVYKRLLDEPNDIEEILATFFGLENARIYENYLLQLIVNFRHLVEALISNNAEGANESFRNLYQIADDMSTFFYNLDPSSSLDQWHSLLHGYVEMLYENSYAIISDNFTGDIGLFDRIIDQSYLLADYMSRTVLSILHPAVTARLAGTASFK